MHKFVKDVMVGQIWQKGKIVYLVAAIGRGSITLMAWDSIGSWTTYRSHLGFKEEFIDGFLVRKLQDMIE